MAFSTNSRTSQYFPAWARLLLIGLASCAADTAKEEGEVCSIADPDSRTGSSFVQTQTNIAIAAARRVKSSDSGAASTADGDTTTVASWQTDFIAFVHRYGRNYGPVGSAEYKMRLTLFGRHVAKVHEQTSSYNAQASSWRGSVSHLADWTEEELRRLRGYKMGVRPGGNGGSGAGGTVQLVSKSAQRVGLESLAEEWTWKDHLKTTQDVRDQGACGSCWAVAAANVLRAHSELYQKDRTWSAQQIVSCTMNPRNCGGKGGCDGATAELAFDYVMTSGCGTDEDTPYHSGITETDGICPRISKSQQSFFGFSANESALADSSAGGALLSSSAEEGVGAGASGIIGWRRLPENKLEAVMVALYEDGPLVVSLHAGQDWNLYAGGVLDNCEKDVVIDHAVMLIGWGNAPKEKMKYWHVQNSWSTDWGEEGFIRIRRRDNAEEAAYCGWNDDPQMGSGCNGGPPKVEVCGSCGILYDAVQPRFKLSPTGLLSKTNASLLHQVKHI